MRTPKGSSESFSEAILVFDGSGRIVWANTAVARLLGRRREEIEGRSISDFATYSFSTVNDSSKGLESSANVHFTLRCQNGLLLHGVEERPSLALANSTISAIWRLSGPEDGSESHPVETSAKELAHESTLKNASEGTFQLSENGEFVCANSVFSEICGYSSPEEFLDSARSRGSVHLYVDMRRHLELLRQLGEVGSVTRFEASLFRRDGTSTWISLNARAVRDSEGRIQYFEGTAQDIGWRKLAEDILNQAEEKWHAVVEGSGDCIVIASRSGLVIFANRHAQQAGIAPPGGSVFASFSTASQQHLRAAIDSAFHSSRPEVLTLERLDKDLKGAPYEVRVVPLGGIDSSERVILIASDLTGRKRAEEVVRESQRLIGRVADASPAILYVYDFGTERYVYVNHQAEKILGYPTDSFLADGESLVNRLVHKDDMPILAQRRRLLAEARDDAVVFEYTYRMRHATGAWRWIRARDVVFTRGPDGRPEQIIGMGEDVTERRRASEELERSREQLRALSARLQEAREEERAAISRRVHDELGQALTALNWEVTKLADQIDGKHHSNPAVTKRLAGMSSMLEAMMQIVRKVAAELRPPILDHFGLVAAIEWQAKEFQERYHIPCDVAARVRDSIPDHEVSTAIFRIFQEVLTNVARHARATRVRVEFSDAPHGFSLIVHDNGRGITEGQKAQSLGILGMKERAHLFGGSIDIKGVPGRGTAVTVHIPVSGRRIAAAPRKESLRPMR